MVPCLPENSLSLTSLFFIFQKWIPQEVIEALLVLFCASQSFSLCKAPPIQSSFKLISSIYIRTNSDITYLFLVKLVFQSAFSLRNSIRHREVFEVFSSGHRPHNECSTFSTNVCDNVCPLAGLAINGTEVASSAFALVHR